MASKAQLKAAEKWAENNKEKRKIITYRSYTKKFINELADEKDLDKIIEMVKSKKQSMQKDD
ncbi:hypothetical protein [Fructilactobacillus sanfranciscensis]|uniref:hypothetical protein n=1 Tax=Fructilactobacillus sanfranciscensis TaxID=1625 RepID=UPI0013D730E1|nr:hypothetical protein [Fructilactobacillus sanfranciscensis]NDR97432.1 hypothetical protein [Fructilactobacillus sanfranciscensis]